MSTPPPTPASRPAGRFPSGNRALLLMIFLAASWIVFSGIAAMADVITPLFLVVNLWIVSYPIQRWMARIKLPGIVGALAVGALILGIVSVFLWSIGWSISALIAELSLPEYQERFSQIITDLIAWLESLGIDQGEIVDQLRNINPQNLIGAATTALGSTVSIGTWTVAFITILVGIVTDAPTVIGRFLAGSRSQPSVVSSLVAFSQGVRRYWIVNAVFGAIVGVADVILLMAMGIPLAVVWGVLSFITNFIPTIGFIIGVIPPVLMALFAKDAGTALLVLVLYFTVNASIQSFIQPRFNGNAVGVTATVAILSLLVWSYALGPLGALLGLPATLLVKALVIDPDPQLRWVNAYIGADPDSAVDGIHVEKSGTASLARREAQKRGEPVPELVDELSDGTRLTKNSVSAGSAVPDRAHSIPGYVPQPASPTPAHPAPPATPAAGTGPQRPAPPRATSPRPSDTGGSSARRISPAPPLAQREPRDDDPMQPGNPADRPTTPRAEPGGSAPTPSE